MRQAMITPGGLTAEAPAPRDGRVHIARFARFDAYVLPFDGFAVGLRCAGRT